MPARLVQSVSRPCRTSQRDPKLGLDSPFASQGLCQIIVRSDFRVQRAPNPLSAYRECRRRHQRHKQHRSDRRPGCRPVPAGPVANALRHGRPLCPDREIIHITLQIVRQIRSRRVSMTRFLGHRFEHDGFQRERDRRVDRSQRFGLVVGDLPQHCRGVFPFDRRFCREEFVQRCAERIDVRAMVHQVVLRHRLFGAHVAQRSDQIAGGRHLIVPAAGQAEIRDPNVASRVKN